MVCTSTACKGKDMFAGGGWGGSEGKKIMSACLLLPTFFKKKERYTNPTYINSNLDILRIHDKRQFQKSHWFK